MMAHLSGSSMPTAWTSKTWGQVRSPGLRAGARAPEMPVAPKKFWSYMPLSCG